MARRASGADVLAQAKEAIASARTIEELRAAQAVVLPLEFGLSIAETAEVIGVSRRWACTLRTRFARVARGEEAPLPKRGGRRRQNLPLEEEAEFLAPFLESAKAGGVLVVSPLRQALEVRLGRKLPLSSVYNLLHRYDWRKLAPDRRHPQSDPQAQEAWKKTLRNACPRDRRHPGDRAGTGDVPG